MKNTIHLIITIVVLSITMTACEPNFVFDNTEEDAWKAYQREYGNNNTGDNGNNGDNNNDNDDYTPYTDAGMPEEMLGGWICQNNGVSFYIYYDDTIYNYDTYDLLYYVISCSSTSLTLRDTDDNSYFCSYTISGDTMTWSGDLNMSFTIN